MESWRAFRDSSSRVVYTRKTKQSFDLPLWVSIPFIISMIPLIVLQIWMIWDMATWD